MNRHYFAMLFLFASVFSTKSCWGQKIPLQTIVDSIFSERQDVHQTIKSIAFCSAFADSLVSFDTTVSGKIHLVVCKNYDELIKYIAENDSVFYASIRERPRKVTDSGDLRIFKVDTSIATKGSYNEKHRYLLYQDQYEVVLKKNSLTQNWEVVKIIYPY